MNDIAGAAPAAAEPVAQPQAEAAPAPQETAAPSEPKIDRSKETARHSLDRAFAEVDKREAEAAGKPKTEAKQPEAPATTGPGRDEQGRFTAKDPSTLTASEVLAAEAKASTEKPAAIASEPPARFSADAKAAWSTAPEAVKGEVNRAIRELEGGLTQYQQAFEPLKPFIAMAQKANTTIHDALGRYTTIDGNLHSNDPQRKLGAIQEVLEAAGLSPRDYAAFIMGQPADQAQNQSDQTIMALRRELADLRNQIGGVTTSIQQRRDSDVRTEVESFAKENPRLNEPEFGKSVARLLETQMAADLPSAYAMALLLNPAPAVEPQPGAPAPTPKPNPDQTRKGQLSIAGAPASGSNPVNRKPPASARESLDRSFAALGLT